MPTKLPRALAMALVLVIGLAGGARASWLGLELLERLAAGTPPPPYTDPSKTTTNALGGLGRTQGWTITVGAGTAVDLMADAQIPSDVKSDVEAPATTSALRFVTVTRVPTSGSTSVSTACARLGPATDGHDPSPTAPPLACPELQDSDASTGGCYLYADSQLCQFTLRPITSCTSYAGCHTPLWARGSTDLSQQLHVTIAW